MATDLPGTLRVPTAANHSAVGICLAIPKPTTKNSTNPSSVLLELDEA
jgi:hypothetical protein